jgi:hypothetical protein
MRLGSHRPTLALLSLFAAACGGAVRSDLLADDPGFGNLGDASVADAGGSTPALDAGVVTTDAAVPFDAGGGAADSGRVDSGGGSVVDAGRPDSGGGVVADAGPGVVDAGASRQRCGPPSNGLSCDRNTQTCCAAGADTGRARYSCELDGDCGGNDVPIECASNADCGSGKVCCGYLQSNSWYSVECVSNCGSSGGFTAFTMCIPGGPNTCPFGRSCTTSQRLVGYGFCN